jgi:hypothetical protein
VKQPERRGLALFGGLDPFEWWRNGGFAAICALLIIFGSVYFFVTEPRERAAREAALKEQVGVLSMAADRRNEDMNRRHMELLLEIKGVSAELRRAVDALHAAGVKIDRAAKDMEQGTTPRTDAHKVTGPGG